MDQRKDNPEQAEENIEQVSDAADEAKKNADELDALLDRMAEGAMKSADEAKALLLNIADGAKDKVFDLILEKKRAFDLYRFNPITEEQLQAELETMPRIIRIVDQDERTEEDVCKDAVAFNDGTKEMRAITVLAGHVGLIDAEFYPYRQESVYYRDPSDPNKYIDLNDYFEYIKKAKVNELNQIAQDLGARHITITLKAEKKKFVRKKDEEKVKAGKKNGTERDHSMKATEYEILEVVSDKTFKGHKPQMPELNYFRNDQDIRSIIDRRLDEGNPIYEDNETLKYSNSSVIDKREALKIEGVLKEFKLGGNATISNQIENEERLVLEYQIEYPEEE